MEYNPYHIDSVEMWHATCEQFSRSNFFMCVYVYGSVL